MGGEESYSPLGVPTALIPLVCCMAERGGAQTVQTAASEDYVKALSVRQPWAWLIVNGYKDIENRDWKWMPSFTGELYIHASLGCTRAEYCDAVEFAHSIDPSIRVPPLEALERGGLVGKVVVEGAVLRSRSPWFVGRIGLVLSKPETLDFIRCKGKLGFFEPKLNIAA